MEQAFSLSFWFNYNDYTLYQLTLALVGSILWVAAYILLIKDARKHKFAEMPFFIACGNFAWETLYAYIFDDYINLGYIYVLGYKAWFFLDIYIIYLIMKYGKEQTDIPLVKKHLKPIMAFFIAVFLLLFYFWIKNGWDNTPFNATPVLGRMSAVVLGTNTAYLLNFGISVLYITLFLKKHTTQYFSTPNGVCRWLGTGLFTLLFWQVDPLNHLLHALGVVIFIIDSYYVYLLYATKNRYGVTPALQIN